MKRFYHLALLIGALIGLFGQSAAIAMAPHCAMMAEQMVAVQSGHGMAMTTAMDCCPHSTAAKHDSKPGKDMMPNCPMMAGCAFSLAMNDAPELSSNFAVKPAATIWPLATQLAGRTVLPGQRPPSIQS